MDELMEKMLDQYEAGLRDRTLKVFSSLGIEIHLYPMELTKKQCSSMLLGTSDTKTFDERFNSHSDFPRLKWKREKYPRDEVIEWYHKNWRRTAL